MSGPKVRFVFVVSTSGSVMNQVLSIPQIRGTTHSVVADRYCPAVDKARKHGLPVTVLEEETNEAFCARLADYLIRHEIDYIISFYTQFYAAPLRSMFQDRIINFHPSLLPSFKGMDGFGDGLSYHVKIIGTTVEMIKDAMDEGKIVMQSTCPVDPDLGPDELRHRIFVQQCKTLIQVVYWLLQGRVSVHGNNVKIRDASYHDIEFVPALEATEALELQVPVPSRYA